MPYIETTASVAIPSKKQEIIKARMGEAIELLPGKSESWLMLAFHENVSMYFRGSNEESCAICQVRLYGSAAEGDYARLTEALTDILQEELEIEADRIYVTYSEMGVWGWNGGNL